MANDQKNLAKPCRLINQFTPWGSSAKETKWGNDIFLAPGKNEVLN